MSLEAGAQKSIAPASWNCAHLAWLLLLDLIHKMERRCFSINRLEGNTEALAGTR